MSTFLNNLRDKLIEIEQEMQNLPRELNSVVTRLDWDKLRSLSLALNRDFDEAFNQYFGKLFAGQGGWTFVAPFVIELSPPCIRPITNEDVQRWRGTYKSDVRVVVGRGKVEVMAASELARECKTTISQIIVAAQQQGYIVLGWDQYQKLLDEIQKLINGDEEQDRITGHPEHKVVGVVVTTTDSTQRVKILLKSPPS